MSFECPPTHHRFKVGATTFELPTRYHLVRPVGSGAYGVVIAADDSIGQRRVAIKKVRETGHTQEARTPSLNRNGGSCKVESVPGLLLHFVVLVVRRVKRAVSLLSNRSLPFPHAATYPCGRLDHPTFTRLYTHLH